MKKNKVIFITVAVVFSVLCSTIIISSTKEKYTLDMLVENADYTVIASRNVLKCENTGYAHVMSAYRGEKPYIEGNKVYTEMYITCPCDKTLGDKIIVVTNGFYFKKDDYCILFLDCIDEEKGLYTPVNGKSGIIKVDKGKLYPMDRSLKKELKNSFTDVEHFWTWFADICEEKTQTTTVKKTESTTKIEVMTTVTPETTKIN